MHQACYTVCTFSNLHCLIKAVWRECCLRMINDVLTGALGVSSLLNVQNCIKNTNPENNIN